MLIELTDGQLEHLADLIAARLQPHGRRIMDATELATHLGVSVDWIYAHRTQLGGYKLGTSTKAPIRFDLNITLQRLNTLNTPTTPAPKHRAKQPAPTDRPLMPIHN